MMQMQYEIREAAHHDILGASEICRLVLCPEQLRPYENNIVNAGTMNAVAVSNGVVIGFITALIGGARPVPDGQTNETELWKFMRSYIGFMGVHPDLQNQGIGSALLYCVCDAIFRQTTHQKIYLECKERPISLYKRAGFQLLTPDQVEREFHQRPKGFVLQKLKIAQ
jgi:ribosomal protein S18 acetylase RimI-like enzyme